jgi:Fe-S-cluster-containing dehydrogenase component
MQSNCANFRRRQLILTYVSTFTQFLSTVCLLAVQRVGYCYDPVCVSVCPHKTRNCEETERRTKKVLEIKVVGYHDSNSGVPSVVTSDDL